jgi:hypothetical protein
MSKKKRILFLHVSLLFVVSLYPSISSSQNFVVKTREDGVEICINKNGPSSKEQTYTFKETLSLGGEKPVPILYQPWQCLVDNEENIYVIDEKRIKKFDNYGTFIQFIGNIGKGPGEFNSPFLRYILKDTLFVSNFTSSRYELFNLEGSYLKTIKFIAPSKTLIPKSSNKPAYYLGENIYLFKSYSLVQKGYSQVSNCKFGFSNLEGDLLKEFDFGINKWVRWISDDNLYIPMPFVLIDFIAKYSDRIYILSQNGSDVFIVSKEGDNTKIIKFDINGKKISREEKNKILSRRKIRARNLINKVGLPERKPLISNIVIDDKKFLWLKKGDVKLIPDVEINNYSYMIINPDGKYIADQNLPIELEFVKKDQIYGYLTNEDGLRIFKRYKLYPK